MATTKDKGGLASKVSFGVEVPSSSRESKYQPLYDLLRENPADPKDENSGWADVTDGIAELAKANGGKTPTAQASAITLRNRGFEATARKVDGTDRVFARFVPEAK